MTKGMGIKIDAVARTATEVKISDLKSMQECVGGYIEPVRLSGKDTLYVDEEGLLKVGLPVFYFRGREFVGNGLVTGPAYTLESIWDDLDFPCD